MGLHPDELINLIQIHFFYNGKVKSNSDWYVRSDYPNASLYDV